MTMAIHIVTEPAYAASTWCTGISNGILQEAKNKKTECFFQKDRFASQPADLIALIGNSPRWILDTLNQMQAEHDAHVILISNTPYTLSVNSIGTDLFRSMLDVLSYLTEDCGRKAIAFYGVNASSTTDLMKLRGFGDSRHVYYNNSDLRSCFDDFYRNINHYDAVVCANDYAAISLLQNLKETAPSQIDRLFVVSFSNLHIAQTFTPSITSVALDYCEYGRTTVNLYRMLLKNPQISTGILNIKSKIIPRDTTRKIPFTNSTYPTDLSDIKESDFFEDEEIKGLFLLETLFTMMNETDEKILRLLSAGASYEQIAQDLFMSVNGIKYRLNKLLESSGIRNRKELLSLYRHYFG